MVQKSYFSFITPQKLVENNALLNELNPSLDLTVISTIESKSKNIDNSFDFSIIKSNQILNKNISTSQTATSTATLSEVNLTPTAIQTTTP